MTREDKTRYVMYYCGFVARGIRSVPAVDKDPEIRDVVYGRTLVPIAKGFWSVARHTYSMCSLTGDSRFQKPT